MPAPPKRYKVGEIMRHSSLSRQTIHNYTMLGLIHAVERTEAGHRLYDESIFDRIKKIEMLKAHRTLNEIREMLEAEDAKDAEAAKKQEPGATG